MDLVDSLKSAKYRHVEDEKGVKYQKTTCGRHVMNGTLYKSAPPVEKIVLYDNYHLQKNEPPGRNPLAAKNRNLFEALEVKCIESVTHLA